MHQTWHSPVPSAGSAPASCRRSVRRLSASSRSSAATPILHHAAPGRSDRRFRPSAHPTPRRLHPSSPWRVQSPSPESAVEVPPPSRLTRTAVACPHPPSAPLHPPPASPCRRASVLRRPCSGYSPPSPALASAHISGTPRRHRSQQSPHRASHCPVRPLRRSPETPHAPAPTPASLSRRRAAVPQLPVFSFLATSEMMAAAPQECPPAPQTASLVLYSPGHF